VDTLFFRRLIGFFFGVCVAFVATLISSSVVYASSNPSYDAAIAACQAVEPSSPSLPAGTCENMAGDPGDVRYWYINVYGQNAGDGVWSFTGSVPAPPTNPCLAIPSVPRTYLQGKYLSGFSAPEMSPASAGPQVSCAITYTPLSPPILDPNSGEWYTYVSAVPSGNPAGGPGVTDGNGDAPDPQPPTPTMPAVNVTATPQICGGGSCYDAATNQYAALDSSGNQIVLPGPTADSAAGGCTSGGNSSICGGSPNAPLPPSPPNSPISSPPTQVQSVDTYTQANPTTGANYTVTVSTYSAAPGGTTSGQQPGDSGPKSAPASSSSTAGTGSYGGGTDCNTPPACSGDVVACGAATTQWATTCKIHTDLAGTGPAPSGTSLATGSGYNQASVWPTQTPGNTPGDAANTGVYDSTGFGIGTTCPMTDMTVPLWGGRSMTLPFAELCTPLSWLGYLVLAFAYFSAAKITMGGIG